MLSELASPVVLSSRFCSRLMCCLTLPDSSSSRIRGSLRLDMTHLTFSDMPKALRVIQVKRETSPVLHSSSASIIRYILSSVQSLAILDSIPHKENSANRASNNCALISRTSYVCIEKKTISPCTYIYQTSNA